jgi:hypothetical protein
MDDNRDNDETDDDEPENPIDFGRMGYTGHESGTLPT